MSELTRLCLMVVGFSLACVVIWFAFGRQVDTSADTIPRIIETASSPSGSPSDGSTPSQVAIPATVQPDPELSDEDAAAASDAPLAMPEAQEPTPPTLAQVRPESVSSEIPDAAAPTSISGVVFDEDGNPIEGITVRALSFGISREARTDEDGKYVISNLPEGAYHLVARSSNTNAQLRFSARTGSVSANITFDHAREISGRVVDSGGRPIPGTYIFTGGEPPPELWRELASAITDSSGAFKFQPQRGTKSIAVAHPNYASTSAILVTDEFMTITLTQGAAIRGTVVLDDEALPGALVTVRSFGGTGGLVETVTDEGGNFGFDLVPIGDTVINASYVLINANGSTSEPRNMERTVVLTEGVVEQVNFAFESETAVIAGRITVNGEVPDQFTMILYALGEDGTDEKYGIAKNEDGTYVSEPLPPGRGKLRVFAYAASANGELRKDFPFELSPGQTLLLDHDFAGGATIYGMLSNLDGGNDGVLVYAGHLEIPAPDEEMTPERFAASFNNILYDIGVNGGQYRQPFIEPGDYTLLAYSSRGSSLASFRRAHVAYQHITLEDGDELRVDFHLQPRQPSSSVQ